MTTKTPNTDTPNTSSTDTPAAQSALQTPTEAVNSGSSQSATVSQEHISKLVGDARKEGKAAAVADLLKTLGVASPDDLKALIEDARKRKESELSESEKAKAELDREKKAKDDALTQLAAERAERRNDRIATRVQEAATKLKANDVETVLMYARQKHAAALSAVMGEDGTIDDKKVNTLLETVKAEKPVYFTPPLTVPGSQSNAGGRVALTGSADAQKRASQNNQKLIRG